MRKYRVGGVTAEVLEGNWGADGTHIYADIAFLITVLAYVISEYAPLYAPTKNDRN